MQENIYDLTVVGGGIGGLYTIYQYLKKVNQSRQNKPRILLLESNNRLGGRVMTINNKGFTYESGAGRFSKDHKLLFDLIKEFDLESKIIALDNKQIFISNTNPGVQINLDTQNDQILKTVKSHNFSDKYLSTHTLYQAINDVSSELAKTFSNYYPYYSELYIMNAKDALKSFERDFSNEIQYYVLAGGLEQIIDKIYNEIKKYTNLDIKLNTKVESIKKSSSTFNIQTNQKTIYVTNKLILALPSKKILEINNFDKSINKLLNLVEPAPLYRIYAKYEQPFINQRIVTDNELGYVIPYNDKGLIMISYTDGKNTEYWHNQSEKSIIDNLNKKIKEILPNIKIPKLEWIDTTSSYWTYGAHYWIPNKLLNEQNKKKILHPVNNLWIVGEAYSNHQAWIEGALKTSSQAVKSLNESKNKTKRKSK